MNETLTTKQDSFCVHYTTIGAETFGNGTKSAIAARYSEKGAYARASELLRNRKVQERIAELHRENMQRNQITVDKVLADFEHDKLMARQAGQYSVSVQCTIAEGKFLAMFTDRHNLVAEPPQRKEMSPERSAECRRLGEIAIREGLLQSAEPALPDGQENRPQPPKPPAASNSIITP